MLAQRGFGRGSRTSPEVARVLTPELPGDKLMTRSIKYLLAVLALTCALEPAAVVQAQVALDVSKLTCGQLIDYKIATSEKIAMWLSGYHHGKGGSTSLDAHKLTGNARKLRSYCARNSQTLVMDAVETVLGPAK
jgi:acid stress chaperone HdeB